MALSDDMDPELLLECVMESSHAWEPQIAQYGMRHKSQREDEGERHGDRESERELVRLMHSSPTAAIVKPLHSLLSRSSS